MAAAAKSADKAKGDATFGRGEVLELHNLLREQWSVKDSKRKRDVVKKVIAYMTLGIDVGRLFPEMIKCCGNTKDIVVKKMCYMFLSTYAEQNPELTLLVVNTMQKDCADEDPMVRGLATRSLTSLRLPEITEYAMPMVKKALEDLSGYVRKTAIMSIAKLFHSSPEATKTDDITTALYNSIKDRDAAVAANALRVLDEVLADEGGVAVNTAMMHHLLGRLRDFNDWEQCTILDLVSRYRVTGGDEEAFAIMNVLDGALRNRNSAVGLATIKAFLHLTRPAYMAEVRPQVFERCRTPMLTLLASATPESSFVILTHVLALVERAPAVFAPEYKTFFCALGEPSHVQTLKMDLLAKLATEATAAPIVNELCEYVTGIDEALSRHALTAIGSIAVRLPGSAPGVVSALVGMLDADADWVRSQTVVVMQAVLRKYPDSARDVLPSLHSTLRAGAADPEGRAAAVWIVGEYGTLIDDAPYLMEPLIDAVVASSEGDAGSASASASGVPSDIAEAASSVEVVMELLTAAMKLFFARPPECQKMLARLLRACLGEGQDAGVRDRALLYYRLLRGGVDAAKEVVATPPGAVASFLDDMSASVRAKIFAEFNSLAVVYGKPPEDFVPESHRRADREEEEEEEEGAAGGEGDGAAAAAGEGGAAAAAGADSGFGLNAPAPASADAGGFDFGGAAPATAPAATPAPAPAPVPEPEDDLGFLGGGATAAVPAPAPAPAPAAPADDLEDLFGGPPAPAPAQPPAAAASAPAPADDFDFFGEAPAPAPAPVAAAPAPSPSPLDAAASLDPPSFQSRWAAAAEMGTMTFVVPPHKLSADGLAAAAGAGHIKEVARGDSGAELKFFFYARVAGSTAFQLMQMTVAKASGAASVQCRTEDAAGAHTVIGEFQRLMA